MATKAERASVFSESDALNAIAKGYAAIRSSTVLVTDMKGTTLALSVTNASKAIPAGVKTFSMWADVDWFCRFNTPADTTDGAFFKANDVVECIIDTASGSQNQGDPNVPTAIHGILASGSGTLRIDWGFGHCTLII